MRLLSLAGKTVKQCAGINRRDIKNDLREVKQVKLPFYQILEELIVAIKSAGCNID